MEVETMQNFLKQRDDERADNAGGTKSADGNRSIEQGQDGKE